MYRSYCYVVLSRTVVIVFNNVVKFIEYVDVFYAFSLIIEQEAIYVEKEHNEAIPGIPDETIVTSNFRMEKALETHSVH
ncbi:hypothetical protein DICVIV_07798 [Dictyocaulus viviparus]|uniref:Uncharacterized protein n=1 Tax=Dictyocaulus viviparus TaxID=29172 RepID=A0A0D8XNM2_DICVI|nr:hypothetical protein DICVIV_07798 [Dictyocaulus viviparus]